MSLRTAFPGKVLGFYCIAVSLSMFAHAQATAEIMKAIIQARKFVGLGGPKRLRVELSHRIPWTRTTGGQKMR